MGESRSALIVATYAYDDVGLTRLKAPAQDAEALSEVLADPDIGGFEVRTVINQPAHVVNVEVAKFFANRKPDELLLLHFSCHGVKDDSGELYFASTDTRLDLLEASAVSSAFVNKVMNRSRSSRVVLLLDCCYAGAFARGMTTRASPGLDIGERLGGRGRAVLTASTALQFAFEGTDLASGDVEQEQPSVFTRALVSGLRTGEADRDLDGMVSLDELYGYMYDEVTARTPHQTPGKWVFGLEGDLYVAKRSTPVTTPSELEKEIIESVQSSVPWQRSAVVPELERVLRESHAGRALAARHALERLADDDSRQVAIAARTALVTHVPIQRKSFEQFTVPIPSQPPDSHARLTPEPEPSTLTAVGPGGGVEAPSATRTVERTDVPPQRAWRQRDKGWPTSSRTIIAGSAVVLALVGATTWWLGRDSDAGSATPPTIPDSTVLLSKIVDGRARLVAVNATTGKEISFPLVEGQRPSISPDRRWVIFMAGDDVVTHPRSNKSVLYRMRPDGSGLRPWLRSTGDCVYASRPSWNPNNPKQLAVTCFDRDVKVRGVWSVGADGTVGERLFDSARVAGAPSWTGNQTIIVAEQSSGAKGAPAVLRRVWTDGTRAPETLGKQEGLPEERSYSDPDWGKDGLLFTAAKDYRTPGQIFIRPNGETARPWGSAANSRYPTWSPTGTAVAWLEYTGEHTFQLWTREEGKDPVPSVTGQLQPPAWGSR